VRMQVLRCADNNQRLCDGHSQPFKQLLHSESEGLGPIVVKIVASECAEYGWHRRLHDGDVHERLRVAPMLTALDGPLVGYGGTLRSCPMEAPSGLHGIPPRKFLPVASHLLFVFLSSSLVTVSSASAGD
jgi:hypothetical protein